MFRRLYDWMMLKSKSPGAVWALSAVAFAESSFFPLPPDIMLIPMVLAKRSKAFYYAFIASLSSIIGGVAGYAIGALFKASIAMPLLNFYGYGEKFAEFSDKYNEWGAWAVLIAGVTPFPFKVITIASGVTGLSFGVFLLACVIARSARFFLVSALLFWFGPSIRSFIENYFGLVTIIFFVLLVGGFAAIKFLF